MSGVSPEQPPPVEHTRRTPAPVHDAPFKPRWKVNWPAVGVIVAIVVVLTLISAVAGLVGALLIALVLVVGNTGTGHWIPGGIGDDTKAAEPERDRRPPDY
jgi:hypothetical protein